MVGDSSDYDEEDSKGECEADDELYNLMRGHTSLMITEDSSDSDEGTKSRR
jgi:hypothetical protein